MKQQIKKFWKQETKKHSIIKYALVVLIITIYFLFSSLKFGTSKGILITIVSWSFLVMCTPIADAGFILDFPIRLITGIRMIFSEIVVWSVAIIVNIITLLVNPAIYEKTLLLRLFHHILKGKLSWAIIVLSATGTFLSVFFADELLDVSTHQQRKKFHKHLKIYMLIIFTGIIISIIILYNFLLKELGIKIPLL